jgi:hypothetical protein
MTLSDKDRADRLDSVDLNSVDVLVIGGSPAQSSQLTREVAWLMHKVAETKSEKYLNKLTNWWNRWKDMVVGNTHLVNFMEGATGIEGMSRKKRMEWLGGLYRHSKYGPEIKETLWNEMIALHQDLAKDGIDNVLKDMGRLLKRLDMED